MAREHQPRKRRVEFRRNRQRPARQKTWSVPVNPEDLSQDVPERENVRAKGALSRKRTIVDRGRPAPDDAGTRLQGTAVAVRGAFVDVLAGGRIWSCSIRRVLRTRRIEERSPVAVGDQVSILPTPRVAGAMNEAVIEEVYPRRTVLRRSEGRRTHTIAANVDQVLIVSSVREPWLKPHLIDRYLVAAHAGDLPAIIDVNKLDLDPDEEAAEVVERYQRIGYQALATSARTGDGIERLRALLSGKATLMAGQSGVGKSSLLNVLDPSLHLPTAPVSEATEKGRHTTTTAIWLPLSFSGAVVDTPGIRALDVAMVPLNELEMHFVEFVDRVAQCKFPNCVHIHEEGCAIQAAVEASEIDPLRYESYVQLFMERSEG